MRILLLLLLCNIAHSATEAQAIQVFKEMSRGGVKIVISNSSAINASCGFNILTLNKGIIRAAQNNDELSIVIGHELTHCRHYDMGSSIAKELRADAEGLLDAKAHGYNVCNGVNIMRRMNRKQTATHPASGERYERLRRLGGCIKR